MKKAIIVDKDPFMVELYTKYLAMQDIATIWVNPQNRKLAEVAEEIGRIKPDVVCIEVVLSAEPAEDGFHLVKEMKNNESAKDVPFLFLTNLGQQEDINEGAALGAIAYIIKAANEPITVVQQIAQLIGLPPKSIYESVKPKPLG